MKGKELKSEIDNCVDKKVRHKVKKYLIDKKMELLKIDDIEEFEKKNNTYEQLLDMDIRQIYMNFIKEG